MLNLIKVLLRLYMLVWKERRRVFRPVSYFSEQKRWPQSNAIRMAPPNWSSWNSVLYVSCLTVYSFEAFFACQYLLRQLGHYDFLKTPHWFLYWVLLCCVVHAEQTAGAEDLRQLEHLHDSWNISDSWCISDKGSIFDSWSISDSRSILDSWSISDSRSILDSWSIFDSRSILDSWSISDSRSIFDG